jgi:hypothetical protein
MELGGTQRENQAGKCSFLWRMVLRGLLVIMLLQTLVFHYFADMVVAVPFTLSLYALTAAVPWSADRLKALGFGILSVAIWLVTLRWGAPLFQVSPLFLGAVRCLRLRRVGGSGGGSIGPPKTSKTPRQS